MGGWVVSKVFAAHWEPWFAPKVLMRAWCLNEMTHAQLHNKPVEVMMII
jgi:hypothetical protein